MKYLFSTNQLFKPVSEYQSIPEFAAARDEDDSRTYKLCNTPFQGAPSFSALIFHDQKMKIHDLSAQHIFPSKRYTTYECIPELVVTVPVRIGQ